CGPHPSLLLIFSLLPCPLRSTLFPYTTLFRSILSNGLYAMRNAWYSTVETGDEYTSLTQIGLTTSENYLDGGKLVFQDGGEAKRSEEHTSELQSRFDLVCRLLLEKKQHPHGPW